jgi:hypothetical protein
MPPDDLTPLQEADPAQGWPRVEARAITGGLALAGFRGPESDTLPDDVLSLSRAGWEALVRLFARRYPATFGILAREEITQAWRGALEEG